jgi:hypothetical protein
MLLEELEFRRLNVIEIDKRTHFSGLILIRRNGGEYRSNGGARTKFRRINSLVYQALIPSSLMEEALLFVFPSLAEWISLVILYGAPRLAIF